MSSSATVTVSSGPTATTSAATTSASRDPAYWPFATYSPWNYPLGSNAAYATPTTAYMPNGFTSMGINIVCGSTIWIGNGGYTQRTMTTTNPNKQSVYGTSAFNIAPPAGATIYSACSDQVVTFISADHLFALDGEGSTGPDASGNFTQYNTMHVDLKGPGWGPAQGPLAPNGTYDPVDETAASFTPLMAGVLRQGEAKGTIQHMLGVCNYYHDKSISAPSGAGYVWPAGAVDGYAFNSSDPMYAKSGNIYMGSIIAIPSSVNLAGVGFQTTEALNIAYALQRYGGLISDTCAYEGNFQVRAEWQAGQNDFPCISPNYAGAETCTQWNHDMSLIGPLVKVITNSYSAGGGQPTGGYKLQGGDGSLPVPPAPPFGSSWGGGNGRP